MKQRELAPAEKADPRKGDERLGNMDEVFTAAVLAGRHLQKPERPEIPSPASALWSSAPEDRALMYLAEIRSNVFRAAEVFCDLKICSAKVLGTSQNAS